MHGWSWSFAWYWGFSHGNQRTGSGAGEEVGETQKAAGLFPSIKMLLRSVVGF